MKAKSSTKTVFYCSECGNETAKKQNKFLDKILKNSHNNIVNSESIIR